MNCPYCDNTNLADDAIFCPNCGNDIDSISDTTVTNKDLANAIEDEYGAKYSPDWKRLLKVPRHITAYNIKQGTQTICNEAFYYDAFYYKDRSQLTAITIPNSVTKIGHCAFCQCSNLTTINIPDSVTEIGNAAFDTCSALTAITIPYGVTKIRYKTLSGCSGLTSVAIPDSITEIEQYAFEGCSALESITLPNSVTLIGSNAFNNCSRLSAITIPSSVRSIEAFAFIHCYNIASIAVDPNNSVYDSRNNCNAIIETASNRLIYGCPNSSIPNSVTTIAKYAFYKTRRLTTISIPDSVSKVEEGAFFGCDNVATIDVNPNNSVYDSRNNCNAIIETSTNQLIYGCKNSIIPNGIRKIGKRAFRYCTGLTTIAIPTSVINIEHSAFEQCSNLTSISIPYGVRKIANSAFADCSRLTTISIPATVTEIGKHAFAHTAHHKTIYCQAATPPRLITNAQHNTSSAEPSDSFGNPDDILAIYVPKQSLENYLLEWAEYASKIKGQD